MASEVIQIVQKLLDFVNSVPNLPCVVALEYLEETPPAMMLQQLSGTKKIKEDLIGGYTAQFPFALYVKTFGTSESDKVDATGTLLNIGDYFDEQTLQGSFLELGENRQALKIELKSFPSMVEKSEDNIEIYQAVFMLEYKQRRVI